MSEATSDAVLARIRQLLAKAESTTFEAEALAFTAKAHELMTRHAIDLAVVDASGASPHDGPITQTIRLDAPYVSAKAMLLQTVAEAGRCRTVFDSRVSASALVGFADDVAAVELLFTSLLVQAQTALAAAARRAPAGANARSRSFRCRVPARLRPPHRPAPPRDQRSRLRIGRSRNEATRSCPPCTRASKRSTSTWPTPSRSGSGRCAPPTMPPAGRLAPLRPTPPTSAPTPSNAKPRELDGATLVNTPSPFRHMSEEGN